MQRRNFNHAGAGLLVLAACRQAQVLIRSDLTPAKAGSGLKTVFEKDA